MLLEKHPLLLEVLPPVMQELFEDGETCDASKPFKSDEVFVNFLATKILCANKLRETLQLIASTALEVSVRASSLERL